MHTVNIYTELHGNFHIHIRTGEMVYSIFYEPIIKLKHSRTSCFFLTDLFVLSIPDCCETNPSCKHLNVEF